MALHKWMMVMIVAMTATLLMGCGSAGQVKETDSKTVFMQVAPERAACSHPLMRDMQCLQVRFLSAADIASSTHGREWTLLYSDIQGYEHQRGTGNVLKVLEYTPENLPQDVPSIQYKLLDVIR